MNKLNIPIYYAVYKTSKNGVFFQKRLKCTDTYESIEYNKQLEKRELDFMHEIERTREMNAKLHSLSENQRLNTTNKIHITPTGNRFDYINKSMLLIQEVLKK